MFKPLLLKNYSDKVHNNQLWSVTIFFSLWLSHSDNKVSLNNRAALDEVNLQFEHKTLRAKFINVDYYIAFSRG